MYSEYCIPNNVLGIQYSKYCIRYTFKSTPNTTTNTFCLKIFGIHEHYNEFCIPNNVPNLAPPTYPLLSIVRPFFSNIDIESDSPSLIKIWAAIRRTSAEHTRTTPRPDGDFRRFCPNGFRLGEGCDGERAFIVLRVYRRLSPVKHKRMTAAAVAAVAGDNQDEIFITSGKSAAAAAAFPTDRRPAGSACVDVYDRYKSF